MRGRFVIIMLLTVCSGALGQQTKSEEEKSVGVIVPERPDQTNSPDLVPKGFFQWETGFVREQDKVGTVTTVNYLFNTSLLRYGIANNFELRLQIDYAGQRIEDLSYSSLVHGFNPLIVGTKIFLCDQQIVLPQSSLLLSLSLPYFASSGFRPPFVAPALSFLFQNQISDRLSIGYNLGLEWDGAVPNATGVVTISLGISVTERLSAFCEEYMYAMEKVGPDHRSDCGLALLLANNLKVDASGGLGVNDKAPDFFVSFGLSWRLPN